MVYATRVRSIVVAVMACWMSVACTATAAVGPTAQPANPSAQKPSNATLRIVSPAQDGVLSGGSLKVSVNYTGPALVPGAEAKKLDDYHLHYFLDEDAGAYLSGGKSIPAGNAHIVHSAATDVAFDNLAPGRHTLSVVMSGNNHVPVTPALADSVAFTVQ